MNRIRFRCYIVILGAVFALASCGGDEGSAPSDSEQAAIDEEAILSYLEENDLLDSTSRDDSGIYYQITSENSSGARASSGQVLSIYYRANALGEQAFDAVTNDGSTDPVKLQYGTNSVYPIGLDEVLGLLREKESGVFYIPSALAFGDLEDLSSIIPPNSVLVIEIELDSIQTVAQQHTEEINVIESYITVNQLNNTTDYPLDSVEILDYDVYYKRLSAGVADDTLLNGDQADIQYLFYSLSNYPSGSPIGGTNGSEILSFPFNQGVVISAIDTGLDEMDREESALLLVPSSQAYGASAFVIPRNRKSYLVEQNIIPAYASKVSPYQILAIELELVSSPAANSN